VPNFKIKKQLRIIVLVDKSLIPPKSVEGLSEQQKQPWKNEYDVTSTLQNMGHDVQIVGVSKDVGVIRTAIEEFKPQIAFNLLAEIHGRSLFEPHVVSDLELLKQPYTGCNPRGLTLAHDKALTKKILAYHRIRLPAFAVFPKKRKVYRPNHLRFPLLVKPLSEEGSIGIARASIVYEDEPLAERVQFIHQKFDSHVIAEEYIEGRELYVAVIGNQRLQTYTPWELVIGNLPEGAPYIATSKLKWDRNYQAKIQVITQPAELPQELNNEILHLSKRIYRILNLSGYARLDYRLTTDGQLYLLEANPNPDISRGEDFAAAAQHSGLEYEPLLQRIINLGITYEPAF
jgi:D-alanine-D-alanine ligase